MITDVIKNKALYTNIHPLFEKGFSFIEEYLKTPLEDGKYEICGEDLYAVISDSTTRTEAKFEAHRKYIDIQFMVAGKEKILCEHLDKLNPSGEFLEADDYGLYEGTDGNTAFILDENRFAVFFPEDAHMPSMAIDKPAKVKKLVVKVKCI